MKNRLLPIRAALALLLSLTAAQAQQKFNGFILGTPGTPSRTLFAAYGGLFRSTDLGATWTSFYLTEPGLPQPAIVDFAIDPTNELFLYLVTTLAGGSIWKSTDGGNTWAPANSGLPTTGPDSDYFTLAGGNLYIKIGARIFKSADHAATWLFQGTVPSTGGHLAIHDAMPSRMYFVSGVVFYRSDDEGRTWQTTTSSIYPPLPPNLSPGNAVAIGTVRNNPAVALVSISDTGAHLGTWRSVDAGGKFDELPGVGQFERIFSGSSGPVYFTGYISGGMCRSTSEGSTWVCPPTFPLVLEAVDPKSRNILYGYIGGPARSTDSGDTWQLLNGTVRPTLAKRATPVIITLEQGTVGTESLPVQVLEDASWAIPFTAPSSGASWLSLAAASGSTPGSANLTLSAANLTPGTYNATVQISSPQAANGSVSVPIQFNVVPRNTSGPFFSIDTVAGNGHSGEMRPSGPATGMAIGLLDAIALDTSGNLYIASDDYRVWRYDGKSTVSAFAGTGVKGFSGNGSSATSAQFGNLAGVAADAQGGVYISESSDSRIRRVTNGTVSPVLDSNSLYDDGRRLFLQQGIAMDPQNRLVIAANTLVGRYTPGATLINVPIRGLTLQLARGVAADSSQNIYVADLLGHQIVRIPPNGDATVFAGTGSPGFAGDGGPATSAALFRPSGVTLDTAGNVYIADSGNNRVRMVAPGGIIRTIAGTGDSTFSGDGGLATNAAINTPVAMAVNRDGSLYVADRANALIRKLTPLASPPPFLDSIGNAAGGAPTLSPGGIFAANGSNLTGGTLAINGINAPILTTGASQLTGQVPYEVQTGRATAAVTVNGIASAPLQFDLVPAAPGILLNGPNQALANNSDGSQNTPDNPATVGDSLTVFLYGIGALDNPVATGAVTPDDPQSRPTSPYTVTVNGQPVDGADITLVPGAVGLAQATFTVPDLPAGSYAVAITIDGQPSNGPQVSIAPQ